jgi:hypothetical protein
MIDWEWLTRLRVKCKARRTGLVPVWEVTKVNGDTYLARGFDGLPRNCKHEAHIVRWVRA